MPNLIVVDKWVIDVDRIIGKFCTSGGALHEVIGFFGSNCDTTILLESITTGALCERKIQNVEWVLSDVEKQQIKDYLKTKVANKNTGMHGPFGNPL